MPFLILNSFFIWAVLISGLLAVISYAFLARAHHSERGIGTIACGGSLHAAGSIWLALTMGSAWSTLAAPLFISGLLILLAGTRRFFARPALLGWWAGLLIICGLGLLAQAIHLIDLVQYWALAYLVMAPLVFKIGNEAWRADNDEHWALPRWLLVTIFSAYALALLMLTGTMSLSLNPISLLILLLLSNVLWPYCYQSVLSHRLHTRLLKLTRYDPLTGAFNRRGIEEYALRELRRAQKYQQTFAIIQVNLTRFNDINHHYGFPAGDTALQHCARILKDVAGQSCLAIGRFTGNDFILLFSNTPVQQLKQTMLEIELSMTALQIEHGDNSFRINSIVSLVRAGVDGENLNDLFASAKMATLKRGNKSTSTTMTEASRPESATQPLKNDSDLLSKESLSNA